ncbi:MAG: hypothetical protein GXP35_08400 [Actinobacteria bacterium]|nr:hypothetical protein [Actinomycetota bacterium]
MISSAPDLDWDDLLDDFEDRVDEIWFVLDHGGQLETQIFSRPEGTPAAPTTAQQDRLSKLQADAVDAAAELNKRLETNRSESSTLQRGSKARRTYVGTKRLGR